VLNPIKLLVSVLFRNSIPLAQERAALSIARDPSRHFEAVSYCPYVSYAIADDLIQCQIRILLAHILSAADQPPTQNPSGLPMVEEISLLCAISRKRLRDPIMMDSVIVDKGFASLRQPKGLLYQSFGSTTPIIEDMEEDAHRKLKQLLSHLHGSSSISILALHVERIGLAPPAHPYSLESVARNFTSAIKAANKTDLVTRGPLDIKCSSVIPPQIVVDEDVSPLCCSLVLVCS
jgi:hypothetical protein